MLKPILKYDIHIYSNIFYLKKFDFAKFIKEI